MLYCWCWCLSCSEVPLVVRQQRRMTMKQKQMREWERIPLRMFVGTFCSLPAMSSWKFVCVEFSLSLLSSEYSRPSIWITRVLFSVALEGKVMVVRWLSKGCWMNVCLAVEYYFLCLAAWQRLSFLFFWRVDRDESLYVFSIRRLY